MENLSLELIAPNFTKVWIQGSGWIAFSYRTIIAFACAGRVVVRQNDWKVQTGKHLNAIDGGSPEAKAKRLTSQEFERAMAEYNINFHRVFCSAPVPENACKWCGNVADEPYTDHDGFCSFRCVEEYQHRAFLDAQKPS